MLALHEVDVVLRRRRGVVDPDSSEISCPRAFNYHGLSFRIQNFSFQYRQHWLALPNGGASGLAAFSCFESPSKLSHFFMPSWSSQQSPAINFYPLPPRLLLACSTFVFQPIETLLFIRSINSSYPSSLWTARSTVIGWEGSTLAGREVESVGLAQCGRFFSPPRY